MDQKYSGSSAVAYRRWLIGQAAAINAAACKRCLRVVSFLSWTNDNQMRGDWVTCCFYFLYCLAVRDASFWVVAGLLGFLGCWILCEEIAWCCVAVYGGSGRSSL